MTVYRGGSSPHSFDYERDPDHLGRTVIPLLRARAAEADEAVRGAAA
jgi:hypothetical protein